MKIIIVIGKTFCNLLYGIFKMKKVKPNKIVFLSRQSDNKSLDFKLIEEQLMKSNKRINCVFLCHRIAEINKSIMSNIIYTIKCLWHLADAKVCVTDSYSIVSAINNKKTLKVIQIWHSLGAIKKFGLQTVGTTSGRDETISKNMKMHANYDYIISGSDAMTPFFAKAFGYPENAFLSYGLPRIDYVINNEKILQEKIYKKYPILKKKKNILYVPTFRTTKDDNTSELINSVNSKKYNLIIKAHPNQKLNFEKGRVQTCDSFTALDLLAISDYVITDYSAISIEAAVLNKKTYYYLFDYEEYEKNNGININLYDEMPGCVFKNAQQLINKLEENKYDLSLLKKYKQKYLPRKIGKSAELIAELIIKCSKEK